jgi:hypothetical protein
VEPCAPQYGIGGIKSFTHVGHCVKAEKLPLTVSQVDAELLVSIPVTSLMKLSALLGFGIFAAIAAIATLARMVNVIRHNAIGIFIKYRFQ